MIELNFFKNRKKTIKHLIKSYCFFSSNEFKHLRYVEIIKTINIYIVETKIATFFKTTHENYEHYVDVFIFNFLIKKVY